MLPKDDRISVELNKYDRKYRLNSIALKVEEPLISLIVLAEGEEEARLLPFMVNALNGERKTVAITKPKETRYSSIRFIKLWLNSLKTLKKLLFIIDQENEEIDKIFDNMANSLNEIGIQISYEKGIENRVRSYNCELGNIVFEVIIVISGVKNLNSKKHKIEDHLLSIRGVSESMEDSKEYWKRLPQDSKEEIYERLKDRDLINKHFSSHMKALSELE
ncbi:MAG: hypothetical protein QXX95_04940 [Nitrososphaerales archaeon]